MISTILVSGLGALASQFNYNRIGNLSASKFSTKGYVGFNLLGIPTEFRYTILPGL